MIPVELVNKIIMMSRPTYKYLKELNNKIEQYIDFHKGFSETLLIWAKDKKEFGLEQEYLNNIRLYEKTLEKKNLNINIKPRLFIERNI